MYQRIIDKLHIAYCIYISLIPALATLAFSWSFYAAEQIPDALVFLFFIPGIAAVGICVAVMTSYPPLPKTMPGSLFLLLDSIVFGVVVGVATQSFVKGLITTSVIEGAAILVALYMVTISSDKPTRGQRLGTLGIVSSIAALSIWLFIFYQSSYPWSVIEWVIGIVGVIQKIILQKKALDEDFVVRDSAPYIVVGVLGWVLSFFIGIAWITAR